MLSQNKHSGACLRSNLWSKFRIGFDLLRHAPFFNSCHIYLGGLRPVCFLAGGNPTQG
jgi:hypothetical protein